MATFRIVLGIVCFAFLGRLVEPGGDILRVGLKNKEQRVKNIEQRNKLITIAQSQLGVREATGNNDGIQVEKYLNYTGNKKGEPWCASFVSWVYGQAGFAQPKTAWSPNLFPLAQQTIKPQVADVFGIYFTELGRIAHCGLVEKKHGNWLYTIEGNTNVVGSREGDGVYRKLRHAKTIKVYADWINEPGKEVHQSKLRWQGRLLKIDNALQAVRSLPRGHFHFSLMKNETKTEPFSELINSIKNSNNALINQVRNEASPLKAIAWPAVPACPTLLGSVLCGGLYRARECGPKLPNINGAKGYEALVRSFNCQAWLDKPRKEGMR